VNAAKARDCDYLIIDTAGRQHTKKVLMNELNKIVRTVEKLHSGFFERIIVVDGSIGGNALSQVKEFSNICALTGVVCTKLDGSYKGGMVVAIRNEFQIPVLFIGLGESENDLIEFSPELFAEAVFEKIQG
jgi:fused signal recognition particle receptor